MRTPSIPLDLAKFIEHLSYIYATNPSPVVGSSSFGFWAVVAQLIEKLAVMRGS